MGWNIRRHDSGIAATLGSELLRMLSSAVSKASLLVNARLKLEGGIREAVMLALWPASGTSAARIA